MKTIITVATTGAWPSKKDNPNIPLSPEEIADDVYECYKTGASIAHIHVRDDEGNGTMNIEKFKKTMELIKKKCDIIINLTSSGNLNATYEDRYKHIEILKPDMCSFDAGTMNWMHKSVFMNPPDFLEKLGKITIENNVKPEIEVFDTSFISNAKYYAKKGLLKEPIHYQFVLGAAGGMDAIPDNLLYLKNMIPKNCTWSALGIGKGHLPIMLTTLALGGHIRVGMEDNVMFSKTELAKSNKQLVKRAADLIKLAGNEIASVEDAKQILGLI